LIFYNFIFLYYQENMRFNMI